MNMLLKLGFCLAISAAILSAQGTGGNITGQVVDPSGLGVPGTRVTAMNLETNVSTATTSSASGNYNIAVYPGTYRLTADFIRVFFPTFGASTTPVNVKSIALKQTSKCPSK